MEREERERGETERDEYGLEMGKLESMKETEFLGSEEEEGEEEEEVATEHSAGPGRVMGRGG